MQALRPQFVNAFAELNVNSRLSYSRIKFVELRIFR